MYQPTGNLAARIEADYERLNRFASSLTEFAREATGPENFVQWKIEALFHLRDFRNQVAKHFDLEEEGGFISDLLRLAPEAANRIELLVAEHAGILEGIDRTICWVKAEERSGAETHRRLRGDLDRIMQRLKNHESVEKELLYTAHNQVYGAGD